MPYAIAHKDVNLPPPGPGAGQLGNLVSRQKHKSSYSAPVSGASVSPSTGSGSRTARHHRQAWRPDGDGTDQKWLPPGKVQSDTCSGMGAVTLPP